MAQINTSAKDTANTFIENTQLTENQKKKLEELEPDYILTSSKYHPKKDRKFVFPEEAKSIPITDPRIFDFPSVFTNMTPTKIVNELNMNQTFQFVFKTKLNVIENREDMVPEIING